MLAFASTIVTFSEFFGRLVRLLDDTPDLVAQQIEIRKNRVYIFDDRIVKIHGQLLLGSMSQWQYHHIVWVHAGTLIAFLVHFMVLVDILEEEAEI